MAAAGAACTATPDASDAADKIQVSRETRDALAAGEPTAVIVALRDDVASDADEVLDEVAQNEVLELRRDLYVEARTSMVASLPAKGVRLVQGYDHLPFAVLEVDSTEALAQLAEVDDVQQIRDDVAYAISEGATTADQDLLAQLAQSPRARTVAVLDTGVDGAAARCEVVAATDVAANDDVLDADGHGTAVAAALLAGAPGISIASVDVVGDDGQARTSDLLGGIEWAIAHRAEHHIGGISLTLPGDAADSEMLATSLGIASHGGLPSAIAFRLGSHFAGPTPSRNDLTAYTAPPTGGTVSIAAGATYSKTTSVTLTIGATGATQMCVSNTATCTAWVTYATTKTWALAAGSGTKTVKVWFRNAALEATTTPASDTIILDTVLPVNGTLSAAGGYDAVLEAYNQITISWTGFADANSGMASYKLIWSTTAAPSTCAGVGLVTVAKTLSTYTVTGLTAGSTLYFRICALDLAGNLSTGASAFAKTGAAFNPPTSTGSALLSALDINAGAEAASATASTLRIHGRDNITTVAPTSMCVSNTPTCTAWTAYAATKSHTLASSSGLKTVYVWFRDAQGNANVTPFVDTIMLDLTVPTSGTVLASSAGGSVSLNWSGFTDIHSGIQGYLVVRGAGTTAPAASCTAVNVNTAVNAVTSTDATVVVNSTYTYRVCAVDKVGRVGVGSTVTVVAQ